MKTTRLLREALGWPEERLLHHLPVALRPGGMAAALYRRDREGAAASAASKRMAIVAPGFSADCLETLEEIGVENREHLLQHGGEQFAYRHA